MCIRDREYGDGANPVIVKSEFIMCLCEQLIGGSNLGAKHKSIIDRCTASVYRTYQQNNYQGEVPTLQAVSYTHLGTTSIDIIRLRLRSVSSATILSLI